MQITKFELSEKLKELGVSQKSALIWVKLSTYQKPILLDKRTLLESLKITRQHLFDKSELESECAAYTLDEVLEMLPESILSDFSANTYEFHLILEKDGDYRFITYDSKDGDVPTLARGYDQNSAEAAGQLLVWCIENGYVKVEEIK